MSGVMTGAGQAEVVGNGRLAPVLFTGFVVVTLVITVWAGRRRGSSEEYFSGGRLFSPLENGLAISGDYLSAGSFLGVSGLIALYGYDSTLYLVGFLVSWLGVLMLVAELVCNCGRFTLAGGQPHRSASPEAEDIRADRLADPRYPRTGCTAPGCDGCRLRGRGPTPHRPTASSHRAALAPVAAARRPVGRTAEAPRADPPPCQPPTHRPAPPRTAPPRTTPCGCTARDSGRARPRAYAVAGIRPRGAGVPGRRSRRARRQPRRAVPVELPARSRGAGLRAAGRGPDPRGHSGAVADPTPGRSAPAGAPRGSAAPERQAGRPHHPTPVPPFPRVTGDTLTPRHGNTPARRHRDTRPAAT